MPTNLLGNNEPQQPRYTVLGEKVLHRGAIFAQANSNGVIAMGNGLFGVRFLQRGDNFIALQVVTKGIDNPVTYSFAPRQKVTVIKQKEPEKKNDTPEIKQEEVGLF
jgi:hypothetical protein